MEQHAVLLRCLDISYALTFLHASGVVLGGLQSSCILLQVNKKDPYGVSAKVAAQVLPVASTLLSLTRSERRDQGKE
jgi:hypothetical protein